MREHAPLFAQRVECPKGPETSLNFFLLHWRIRVFVFVVIEHDCVTKNMERTIHLLATNFESCLNIVISSHPSEAPLCLHLRWLEPKQKRVSKCVYARPSLAADTCVR